MSESEQYSLFEDPPPEWKTGAGIGGFVAYANGLATESWNTPSAAIKAAQAGQVSKKWYRQFWELQQARQRSVK